MANRDGNTNPSFLSRLVRDTFWLSAGATAISDWLTGRSRVVSDRLTNEDVRFEHSDISVRTVLLTGLGVFLFFHISVGVVYFVFEHFKHVHTEESLPALPIAAHGLPHPPEPQIQQSPRLDLREFEAAESAQLNSYQWIDQQKGSVAIPIDRAMDLIVQRGIPAEKGSANAYYSPHVGTRMTGFEGKVEPEPR
jgi:hypothetical protein